MIRSAFKAGLAVGILRGFGGFTHSQMMRGSIDVWWLAEDGGLTILLPFILQKHEHWRNCVIRVFTLATDSAMAQEQARMKILLTKLRIRAQVHVINSSNMIPSQKAEESSRNYWEKMCRIRGVIR